MMEYDVLMMSWEIYKNNSTIFEPLFKTISQNVYIHNSFNLREIYHTFKKSWICSDEIMSKNSFNRCWYEVSRVEREDDTRECFWVMGLVIIYLIPYSNNAHNISRVYNYRILAYWNRELSQVIKIQHTINYSLLRFI